MNCVAILPTGEQCKHKYKLGHTRCGTHIKSLANHGPHKTARTEQFYIHNKQRAELLNSRRVDEDMLIVLHDHLTNQQRFEKSELIAAQHREIAETGVDPDLPARQEKQRRALIRRDQQILRDQHIALQNFARPAAQIIVHRTLRQFAADPQNIHTTEAVTQTKEMVSMITKIHVPPEYRWDAVNASKTPFEIGMECKLTQRAAWQMVSQYAMDTAIYDIEPGIYGKVLDCVWQYIKSSPDKEDLCKVIKQEMEDNIGMCAQGNLSRICNVLAGYMEGIGPQESVIERLGRLLPSLMSIDDPSKRIEEGKRILQENKVPFAEWTHWLVALED